jgi:hypothetical protein
LGMPLAVGMLLDDFRRDPNSLLSWESGPADNPTGAPEEILERIVAKVTGRVLRHLDKEDLSLSGDFASIVAMAVTSHRHADVMRAYWGAEAALDRGREIQSRHCFIEGSNLHVTVRKCLRKHYRLYPPKCLDMVLQRLRSLGGQISPCLSDSILDTTRDEFDFDVLVEDVNLQSWTAGERSLSQMAGALLLYLAFEKNLADIIELASEIRASGPYFKALKLDIESWKDFPSWLPVWANPSFDRLIRATADEDGILIVASRTLLVGRRPRKKSGVVLLRRSTRP